MKNLLCVLCLLSASPGLAQEDPDSARDAAIFGGEPTPSQAKAFDPQQKATLSGDTTSRSTGQETGRDASIFGGNTHAETESTSEEVRLESQLAQKDNPLTIGGRLYMRSSLSVTDEDIALQDRPFRQSAQLYLYGDSRPTDRVRIYTKARVDNQLSGTEQTGPLPNEIPDETRVQMDQLWLKFDIDRWVYLTLGQQPIRWGAGRIWNPTDFVNAQRRDPLAIFDARPGLPLLKVHLPFEASETNVYAIAQFDDAQTVGDVGGVFRIEQTLGPSELSATVAARRGLPHRYGLDYSVGIGPVDLRLEGAVTDGRQVRYTGPFVLDLDNLANLQYPEETNTDVSYQGVAGLEWGIPYADDDTVYLTLEYFYNSLGYDDESLYPWLIFTEGYTPLYLGQHYLAAGLVFVRPYGWNDSSFILNSIINLSDESAVVRLDYQVRLMTRLSLFLYGSTYLGSSGEFRFSLDIPSVDGVPELKDGLSIAAPKYDVGVWLAVDL